MEDFSCFNSRGKRETNCVYLFMKNCRPLCGEAYVPTTSEHIANVGTHGIVILPSLLGLKELLSYAGSRLESQAATVYGCAIIALFTMSTVYHIVFFLGKYQRLKLWLHIIDRATIYLFIAASYTPWLMLRNVGSLGEQMRYLVWCFAFIGIVYQYVFHERYKSIELILYLFTAIAPAISLLSMEDWSGLSIMAAGGLVFIIGAVFFKSDGIIPCAHAIWHLHVVIGAAFHYYAVKVYLLGGIESHPQMDIEPHPQMDMSNDNSHTEF